MINEQILILASILLFFIIGFLAKNHKIKSIDEFSTNRNKISWFVTMCGVSMTFVGGAALINMASLGYVFGWSSLVDPISVFIGIMIAVFFINKYRKDNGVTISQLLSSDNKKLSLFLGIVSTFIFLLVTAAQFVAFSKLLSPYFPSINPIILILIPSAIILVYVYLGGFKAVTNTDVLQLAFIFSFLLIPVWYFVSKSNLISSAGLNYRAVGMPFDIMILLAISLLFIPISQDINIRAKSAKDNKNAIIGFIGGAVCYVLIVTTCIFMGITLAKSGLAVEDPEQAFSIFFRYYFPHLSIFVILAGMAAIWSTLDTYLLNGITSVSQDIFKKFTLFKDMAEKKILIISGLVIYILAMLIGLYFNQVLSLVLTALLIYISVMLPIAFAKWIKINSDVIFIISLLITLSILVVEIFRFNIGPKAIIYPLFGVILMIFGKIFEKIKSSKIQKQEGMIS